MGVHTGLSLGTYLMHESKKDIGPTVKTCVGNRSSMLSLRGILRRILYYLVYIVKLYCDMCYFTPRRSSVRFLMFRQALGSFTNSLVKQGEVHVPILSLRA